MYFLQVRNLKPCVKVAIDFLVPESVPQAIGFADDFRQLGKPECNGGDSYVYPWDRAHGDKLQYELSMYLAAQRAVELLQPGPVAPAAAKAKPTRKRRQ
jgi:hypothetical protein